MLELGEESIEVALIILRIQTKKKKRKKNEDCVGFQNDLRFFFFFFGARTIVCIRLPVFVSDLWKKHITLEMIFPSILAHMMSGITLFVLLAYAVSNAKQIQRLDTFSILSLLLLSSMALGIHGISHGLLEKQYAYNPMGMIFQTP